LGNKNRALVKSVTTGFLVGSEAEESPAYYFVGNSSNIPKEQRQAHYLDLLHKTFKDYGLALAGFQQPLLDIANRCDELKTSTIILNVLPAQADLDKCGYASGKLGVPHANPSLKALWEESRSYAAMKQGTCAEMGPTKQARLVMNEYTQRSLGVIDVSDPHFLELCNIEAMKQNMALTPGLKLLFHGNACNLASKHNFEKMLSLDHEHDEVLESIEETLKRTL
jgi:hypothetical protein